MDDEKSKVWVSSTNPNFSGVYIEDGIKHKRIVYKRQSDRTYLKFSKTKSNAKFHWVFTKNDSKEFAARTSTPLTVTVRAYSTC